MMRGTTLSNTWELEYVALSKTVKNIMFLSEVLEFMDQIASIETVNMVEDRVHVS